jgi:AraC family transcriptional activator of mar-sox-rob regulon
VLLAVHGKAQKSTSNQDGQKYRQKILEIVKWVDTQLHATTSLEALAEQFGMSRSLLTREFRRYTGKSFIDYCNSRRVEKAALILASSKESITRIALESGFSNLSHFHRQFKSIYGLTPAVFRRQIFGTP